MKWDVMDIRYMTYPDAYYDIIIDKSTIDAILCTEEPTVSAAMVLSECQRVLRAGGVYISISYENPLNRDVHFERDHLGFLLKTIRIQDRIMGDIKIDNFIYFCKKSKEADAKNKANYERVMKELRENKVQ